MASWRTDFRAYMTELSDAREEKARDFGGRLNEDRRNKEEAQQRLALGIARLSPTSAFSLAATNLAGTSLDLKQRYMQAATAYQREYARFIREKTGTTGGNVIIVGDGQRTEEPDPIDPNEIPAFVYTEFGTDTFIENALPDLGILLLFNLVFSFGGAFLTFLRYDVR